MILSLRQINPLTLSVFNVPPRNPTSDSKLPHVSGCCHEIRVFTNTPALFFYFMAKTELLELQKAPPQQSGVSSGAFSSRDRPSLMNRFSVNLPSLLDENTWAPTDSGRESPPAKSARKRRVSLTTEKEEKRPREASFVVDLKAELRTESERAAAASRQPKQTENVPDSPRVRLEDAELLSPTTPYSSTDGSLPTDGVPLKAFTQGDSEKVGFQSSSESSTSTARSLPQEVSDFSRGPRKI